MRRPPFLPVCAIAALCFAAVAAAQRVAATADPIKIACVGDSITFGAGVEQRGVNCYPAQLQRLLGNRFAVANFGVNGATMLTAGDKPYREQNAFRAATEFGPSVVVLCLGTNDTKPQNWRHADRFSRDAEALVQHFLGLEQGPVVWLCLPPPAVRDRWGINEKTLADGVRPVLGALARRMHLPTIDLALAFAGRDASFPDGIHPDASGATVLAQAVRDAVFGNADRVPFDLPRGLRPEWAGDFATDQSLAAFWFTDPKAWRLGRESPGGRPYLELFGKSRYKYEVRSPLNIALLHAPVVDSFVLDLEMQQTGREYGHRDLCLFFGFRDRSHFYYAHIATKGDAHAHKIFAVDGKPRKSIAEFATDGYDWGKRSWRHIRLTRDIESGRIAVFADDMTTPIMTATDKRFSAGRIGFGSFDDTGRISRVRLYGRSVKAAEGGDPFGAGRK